MSVSTIIVNDSWPTALLWVKNRESDISFNDRVELLTKCQINAHVVYNFEDALSCLALNNYHYISIHVDNLMSDNTNIIETIATSVRSVCTYTSKPVPKIKVHANGFNNKDVIQKLLDSSIEVINLNIHLSTESDWQNINDGLLGNKRYIDPATLRLMRSKPKNTFAKKIQTGSFGYYLCPRVPVTEEIKNNVKKLKQDLNHTAKSIDKFIDLFPIIADLNQEIDIIWVDAEEMADHGNVSPYQLINTIATMIETTGRKYRTKLCITVDSNTPVKLMRELQRIPGVYSLFGRSPEFNYVQIKDQIRKILIDRDPTPIQIKSLLSGKPKKNQSALKLTGREVQIRDLVCKNGSSNKVIANTLGISEATIKHHIGSVYKKYGVKCRTELLIKLQSENT